MKNRKKNKTGKKHETKERASINREKKRRRKKEDRKGDQSEGMNKW